MVNYLRNFNTILDNHPPMITEILSSGIKHCLSSSIFAHNGFQKDWKEYFDALIDDFFDIYLSFLLQNVFPKRDTEKDTVYFDSHSNPRRMNIQMFILVAD